MNKKFRVPRELCSLINTGSDENISTFDSEKIKFSRCIEGEEIDLPLLPLQFGKEDVFYGIPESSCPEPIIDPEIISILQSQNQDAIRMLDLKSNAINQMMKYLLPEESDSEFILEEIEFSRCIEEEEIDLPLLPLQFGEEDIYFGIPESPCPNPITDPEIISILQRRNPKPRHAPDLSLGFGKKQENLELVSLEKFIVSELTLMVYMGELCVYQAPCWKQLDRRQCTVQLRRLFRENHLDSCLTEKEYRDLYRLLLSNPDIQRDSEFDTPSNLLNLTDGTLDIEKLILYQHKPEDGFFTYLDIESEEILGAKKGEVFEHFIQDISNGNPDIRKQVLELIALAITGYEAKVFYALLGPSNSGKTQLSRFITELLGRDQVMNISGIQELGGRFTLSSMENKKLCLCPDLPDAPLPAAAIGAIKQSVGNDAIKIEAKYKNSKTIYKKPLFVFVGNYAIRVPNASKETALMERMVIIPFAEAVPAENRTEQLYKLLLSEAPYIIAQAIYAYRELLHNNFNVTRSAVPAEYLPEESREQFYCVKDFIENCCKFIDNEEITTESLYMAYQTTGNYNDFYSLSKIDFSRLLSQVLADYDSVKAVKRVAGKELRGYKGITLI